VTTTSDTSPTHSVLQGLDSIIKPLGNLYRDLHTHPELSDQEHRTAAKAAEQLEWAGCEVTTGIGGTGVVGVLRNGDGPTVMLRADMKLRGSFGHLPRGRPRPAHWSVPVGSGSEHKRRGRQTRASSEAATSAAAPGSIR